jgi:predicted nucleic acid-binding protein
MILFDTSVIIDARDEASPWHEWAKEQIAEAASTEGAAANSVTIAEASVRAADKEAVPRKLEEIGLALIPLPVSAAIPAAKAFAVYLNRLKAEGKTESSKIPLPDFFIGAHAEAEGMTLVTRDPARVKTYFPSVKLVLPD